MKHTVLLILCSYSVWMAIGRCQTVIARWDFNTETLLPFVGTGTATLVGGVSGTFAVGSSSDDGSGNNRAWNVSGFPSQGQNPRSAGVQFAVDTTGYERIWLTWDQRFSPTASRRAVVEFSGDAANFVDAIAFDASGDGWTNSIVVDLSLELAIANNPLFVFRILSDFGEGSEYIAAKTGSTYGSGGTWRFDQVVIKGTPIGTYETPPAIVTQPRSLSLLAGSPAVFTVEASGSEPLQYQWCHQNTPLSGATEATLTLPSINKSNEGTYHVVVSNIYDSVTSDEATLTVFTMPIVQFTNVLERLVRPGDAPTNTFTEHAVRPGESLTIAVAVTDADGGVVAVEPDESGAPPSAHWDFAALDGVVVTGAFEFEPGNSDAGHAYSARLLAKNEGATNTAIWHIYVPSPAEQRVILTEYLANPTSAPDAPFFNPLRRGNPAENPSQHDEYIELVNLSETDIDLHGWSIADASQSRHTFQRPLTLAASNALVVYGGPVAANPPLLDVVCEPVSATGAGLSLNNTGDIVLVRNADSNLVLRVVYTDGMVASDGAMTRYPDADSPFVSHAGVADTAASPGLQPNGMRWDESDTHQPDAIGGLTISTDSLGAVILSWESWSGATYTVWAADGIDGPYRAVIGGLTNGRCESLEYVQEQTRFYRVSSP